MIIKPYDKVLLKNGDIAYIVEIYKQGEAYEADIAHGGNTTTDTIFHRDISRVFS